MDSLQAQVVILNTRVDALHQMLEQLSDKTSEVLLELRLAPGSGGNHSQIGASVGRYSYQARSSFDLAMEHKDILLDTIYPDSDSHGGEQTLAPEIQIQRLTAQLTAAYNRIAALEEQLLAQRIH